MSINTGNKKSKLYIGSKKVRKGYLGNTKIYSSGNIVTYCVDTGVTYREEVDEGTSCLSPKTFTPAKSGWQFAGWRQDKTASGSVLNSLAMGDAPVTLYATFRKNITLSYDGNNATSGSTAAQTERQYYNNGNVVSPTFTLQTNGFVMDKHDFTGWSINETLYSQGAAITLSSNTIAYASWKLNLPPIEVEQNPTYVTYNTEGHMSIITKNGKQAFECGAYVNHELVGTSNPRSGTGTLSIKLNGYQKAIVIIRPYADNYDAFWEQSVTAYKRSRVSVNGQMLLDTGDIAFYPNGEGAYYENKAYTYTFTNDTTLTISVNASIQNYDNNFTRVNGGVIIESITLSI